MYIIFLNKAKNNEVFAFPKAINDCWQAICIPNIPDKAIYILKALLVKSNSSGSLLNISTNDFGVIIAKAHNIIE